MVARLAPPKRGSRPYRVLDMAGGTGDIAERIVNASVGYAEVTVADINAEMLRVGEERAKKWRFPGQVDVRRGQCRRRCRSRTRALTPTPSPSASGTCRASRWRSRRRIAC